MSNFIYHAFLYIFISILTTFHETDFDALFLFSFYGTRRWFSCRSLSAERDKTRMRRTQKKEIITGGKGEGECVEGLRKATFVGRCEKVRKNRERASVSLWSQTSPIHHLPFDFYSPSTLSLIFFCSASIHRFLSAASSSGPPRILPS